MSIQRKIYNIVLPPLQILYDLNSKFPTSNFMLSRSWLFRFSVVIKSVKRKVVFVLNYAPRHEDMRGSGDIAQYMLNRRSRYMGAFDFTNRPLYIRGWSPVLNWKERLGGSRAGLDVERKAEMPANARN